MIILIIFLVISIGLAITLTCVCNTTIGKRWVAAGIIPILCMVAFLSWQGVEELKGHATSIMPIKNFEIISVVQSPPLYIYYLIRSFGDREPILIVRKWTKEESEKATMIEADLRKGVPKAGKIGRPSTLVGKNGNNVDGDELKEYDLKESDILPK